MKQIISITLTIFLGIFAFTACVVVEKIGDELVEIIREELDIAADTYMIPHMYDRLSLQIPSDFREVFEPEHAFMSNRVVILLNRIEDDAGIPVSFLVLSTIHAYTAQGFEQIGGGLNDTIHSRNLYMNGVMWRNVDMINNDAGQLLSVYIMSSGSESYSISFLTSSNPTDEDIGLIEQIFSTVAFDDSHHKAELEGLWRGVNYGYGYIVFDGGRFYWFLEYEDMDNVLIGNYHVMKGFSVTETTDSAFSDFIHNPIGTETIFDPMALDGIFHTNGYKVIVYYTDVFFNGVNTTEAFLDSQSFTFVPHFDNELRFTVHTLPGNQEFVFERVED